ncbi:MAG: hypothetical protein IJA34_06020 [Lachnospiraceae bacterium]|nr:hypothetical protein [Lachnospiraceae bacterium]
MSKKNKKRGYWSFILTHKKFLVLFVIIALSFVCVPHIYEQIKGEDAPIALQLKDPNNAVNSEENPYILDSVDDFIILQEYSKNNDCYGMYFEVGNTLKNNKLTYSEEEEDEEGSELGGVVYNLNLVGTLVLEDESKSEFIGIGQNYLKPFRGNIMFSGITIRLDTPLFCFLGSGASIEELNMFGKIVPDKMNTVVEKNATVGTLAGMAILDSAVDSLNISTVSVSNKTTVYGATKPAGGLIGTVIGDPRQSRKDRLGTTVSKPQEYNINLDGITITDDTHVMCIGTGTANYTSFSNHTIGTLNDNFVADAGGVIGVVSTTHVNLNVNFTGTTLVKGSVENNKNSVGGVIGTINLNVCVKFDGDVDVQGLTALTLNGTGNYARSGYVIGSMMFQTLAYMTEGNEIKKPVNDELAKALEVGLTVNGVSGQIFKNTSEEVFAKNNAIVNGKGTDAEPYIIDSIDDIERLSALLCSTGSFGCWYNADTKKYDTWFELPDSVNTSNTTYIWNHLRKATYQIATDLDLSTRGIEKINRRAYDAFQGSIIGLAGTYKDGNAYPTIYQNVDSYNSTLALIPYAYGNLVAATATEPAYSKPLVFKDFRMEGKVSGAYSVHGLIYDYINSNTNYSGIEFNNIEMNLDLESKELNNSMMAGFVCYIRYYDVTNAIDCELNVNFNNIKYNGKFITNSNDCSYGSGLIGYLYGPHNNMTSTVQGNKLKLNINDYDFTSEEIKSTGNGTHRICSTINQVLFQGNRGYISKDIAGLASTIYHRPVINMNNINIHDIVYTNGANDYDQMGGVLAYSLASAEVNLNNINVTNIDYNLRTGFGFLFINNLNGSFVEMDKVTFENVNIYKEKNTANENYNMGAFVNEALGGIVTVKDYIVNNSNIYLFGGKERVSETVFDTYSYNNSTQWINHKGLFSFEGNDKEGNRYTAVNTYNPQFKYTNKDDTTQDYYSSSWTAYESGVSYNTISNMEGKHISGIGSKDDPFVIDDEAKLTLFSAYMCSYYSSLDYYLKYFSDIEEMLTEDEKNTLSWVEKYEMYFHRIVTGYYVFASDMDLTEHAYYPAMKCAGKYYGFDVYEFTGKTTLTDEELKMYSASAISAIEDGASSNGISPENVLQYKPEIHFAADKVAEGIRGTAVSNTAHGTSPTASRGMHLKLHGGLFGEITGAQGKYKGETFKRGNVTISNLKLSGVACGSTMYGRGGGFLISGYDVNSVKNAKLNISNIDFQNAMIIQGYNVGTNDTVRADGLLIETIDNSEVNITGIKILADSEGNANIRASALIGYQTGTNSKVIFRDIDLNAVIDQGTITPKDPTNTEEYLPIEEVDFETTEKEAYFRSAPANIDEATMTEAEKEQLEAFNKYGYGFRYGYFYYNLAAGAAIYYYDVGTDIVTPGRTAESIDIDTKILSNDILLRQVQKYAYRTINVDVNPESANIIHGTGTKTDPYIIENLGQLVTLSNFIRYKGDIIDYKTWYVGESTGTGYDETDPDTWVNDSNLIYRNRLESDEIDNRIKSVEYLTKAHYKITADIDFSNPNSYFAQAAQNFNGIGIEDYPFAGSFVGEVKSDGTYPKILIGNSSETYVSNFSIIQYAKGAKISNIDIVAGKRYEENVSVIKGSYSYVEGIGAAKIYLNNSNSQAGMLINNIVGGDNIIDNVSIGANVQLKATQNAYCYIGGYVGIMKNGTLTIGNMKKSTFEDFQVNYLNNGKIYQSNYESNSYAKYTSAIVGDYYNGCIIIKDEDLNADKLDVDTSPVVTVEEIEEVVDGTPVTTKYNTIRVDDINYYNKYKIPCSFEYNPINYNYIEKMNTKENRIKVIKDERADGEKSGSFICQIDNADQLFLLSLIVNSGSLSPVNSTAIEIPYTLRASTQKYDEDFADWIANENAGKDIDIKLTESYDMPMFFKFFDFTALDNGYRDVYETGHSLLSTGVPTNLTKDSVKRTTYMLTNPDKNYVYNMAAYGPAFTGIGPKGELHTWETGNNYHFSPSLCFNANFDGNGHTIYLDMYKAGYTGLFTILKSSGDNNSNAPYEIGNFTIRGSVKQNKKMSSTPTGAVAGTVWSVYVNFKDITLAGLEVSAENGGNVSGVLGNCANYGYQVKFENINIGLKNGTDENGDEINNSVLVDGTKNSSAVVIGGLVSQPSQVKANNINMTNTKIIGKGSVGGVVGTMNLWNWSWDSYINDVTITDTVIETTGTDNRGIGLILGYTTTNNIASINYPLAIHNIKAENCKLIAPTGSVAGIIEGYHTNCALREVLKFEHKNIKDKDDKEITTVWECRATDDTCTYIYHNEFYELENAEELFGVDREAVDINGKLIAKYSECLETNFLSNIDANNDGKPDDIDLIPSTDRMDNVILKWSSDNGTMESVINSLLSSLTGGTGLLNDINNSRMTVTVTPMQVKDGVVSERTDGATILTIIKNGGKFIISNNNKFDSFEKDDSPATYSIVTISYTVVGQDGHTNLTRFTETIEIPMFISNMVNVDIYSKVMIGQEYDKDIMRAITLTSNDAQVTTKDSSYTVYTEYLYSANRIDFDEELYMNKGFRLYDAPDPWIKKGTKLTLIDLTFEDNPITYYYDVKEQTEFVPLSYFTDEAGNHYAERDINKLSELPVTNSYTTMYVNGRTWKKYDRGVEKYLLFVDCTKSEIPIDANQSNLSPFIIDGVPNGQTEIINKEVFYIKYRTFNTLSTFAGRKIEFIDDSLVTEGEINKEKQLNVKVSYSDIASDYYWSDIKQYDYNNQGKYLEVAVYLKNDKDEKVMLPSGTRIMYPGSTTVYESVKNTSAIFYYKDGVKKEGYALMDKTENTIEDVEFTLDFTYAKMDKLPSGQYKICFDLVRNTNKDFPMGDDLIDTIESEDISVSAGAEYGFRLDTNGKDTLAFNIADVADGTVSEVNFGLMINSTLPVDIAENKKAVIKFNLYKKDEDSGNFVSYKDDIDTELTDIELEVEYNSIPESVMLNEVDYEYKFEGISGINEEATRAECKLRLPYDADINNYKLQAELYIDGYKQASDFFVVNLSDIRH